MGMWKDENLCRYSEDSREELLNRRNHNEKTQLTNRVFDICSKLVKNIKNNYCNSLCYSEQEEISNIASIILDKHDDGDELINLLSDEVLAEKLISISTSNTAIPFDKYISMTADSDFVDILTSGTLQEKVSYIEEYGIPLQVGIQLHTFKILNDLDSCLDETSIEDLPIVKAFNEADIDTYDLRMDYNRYLQVLESLGYKGLLKCIQEGIVGDMTQNAVMFYLDSPRDCIDVLFFTNSKILGNLSKVRLINNAFMEVAKEVTDSLAKLLNSENVEIESIDEDYDEGFGED